MKLRILTLTTVLAAIALLAAQVATASRAVRVGATGTTTLVSVSTEGRTGNGLSHQPSISADGRYVAFTSDADNLVPEDAPLCHWGSSSFGCTDIFVHDRETGEISLVSVASDGSQANGDSGGPSISADGRHVAFSSYASNLVPNDTYTCNWYTNCPDVFVHDRENGQTSRVSVASDGTQADRGSGAASISADGRYVAFVSDADNLVPGNANGIRDVFVHDRETGQTSRVSVASNGTPGNDDSRSPSISADGRYVAFVSDASNLVPGDTNMCLGRNCPDVFVHDRKTGETTRVSVASDGTEANWGSVTHEPAISGDGRYVSFQSNADNLVPGDTNRRVDVFVHDRVTGETERVSVTSDGVETNTYHAGTAAISADGRYVVFSSNNLVPGDSNDDCWAYSNSVGRWTSCRDVYVHDRETRVTSLVSVATWGAQANDWSGDWAGVPSISADGRYVAFVSGATNLALCDDNDTFDVFVHDRSGLRPKTVINFEIGAPGSYFTISGENYTANEILSVSANGEVLGSVAVDETGRFRFLLATDSADEGTYLVKVATGPCQLPAHLRIVLDEAEPVRPPEGDGPIFDVPSEIAYTEHEFLPMTAKRAKRANVPE